MSSIFDEIDFRVPGIPIGVVLRIDSEGNFEYVAAVEVTNADAVPVGLEKVQIPPRQWAIFEHDDHITTLSRTYSAIWNQWLPEHNLRLSDAPSIERHKPTFDTRTGNGGVEIWIPIED